MDAQQEAEDTGNGHDNEEKLGDEDSSDDSDDYEEEDPIKVKDADDFIHHILRRLRSGYRMSNPRNYVAMITSMMESTALEELDALICLLVKSGLIPLLPDDDEYDDDAHDLILEYLEDVFSEGIISCDKTENRSATGIEYTDSMYVSRRGIDWEVYSVEHLDYYELDESIKRFPRLENLKIDSHCGCLPSGLSELKHLRHILIMDNEDCEEPTWPSRPDGFPPPLELGTLKEIYFDLRQSHEQQVSIGIRYWLANASFPVLEQITFGIEKDGATQALPKILAAVKANKHLNKLPRICIQIGLNFQDVSAVVDVFLNLLPEMCPNLSEFALTLPVYRVHGPSYEGPVKDFSYEVGQRLRNNQYSEALLSSSCMNLKVLSFPRIWNYQAKNLEGCLAILKFFPRLSYISDMEYILFDCTLGVRKPRFTDSKSAKVSTTIDYLLRINHGGVRVFLSSTALVEADEGESEILPPLPPDRTPLPVSVWPYVIKREDSTWSKYELAMKRKHYQDPDCTALYRMLRPNSDCLGPALQSILEQKVETLKRSLNKTSECESSRTVKAKKED